MKKISIFLCVFLASCLVYGQVTDGLVGHFPFTNGSFEDMAGYQDCVLSENGDSTYYLSEDRFGNDDYAIDFQGAVFNAGKLSRDVTNEVSVSLWMKTLEIPEDVIFLINKYYCVEPPLGYHLAFVGDSVTFDGRDDSPNAYMRSGWSETAVNDGEWHHIVGLARSEGTWEIWVDANKEGSNSYSAILGLNHYSCNLGIAGPDYINEVRIYKGVLDDIRFYNRALDPLEIDSLFNESNPVNLRLNELVERSLKIKIYPVPATDFIYFETSGEYNIKKINIYNSLGILIHSYNDIPEKIALDNLQDGLYFLEAINNESRSGIQKFAVMR